MNTITLTNSFHGTKCAVIVEATNAADAWQEVQIAAQSRLGHRGRSSQMTNHPNRSKQIVKGRARKAFVGDTVYLMTQQHEDVAGETWAAGTEYTPFYAGANNLRNRMEQVIMIAGQKVTFAA